MFGRIPRIPLDLVLGRIDPKEHKTDIVKNLSKIHRQAKAATDKAKLRHKVQYDKKRKDMDFKIGDLVLWKHHRLTTVTDIPKKFKSNVFGPFRIIGIVAKNAFRLQHTLTGEIISEAVNGEKLQKYYEKWSDKPEEIETLIHEVPFVVEEEHKNKIESDSEEDEPPRPNRPRILENLRSPERENKMITEPTLSTIEKEDLPESLSMDNYEETQSIEEISDTISRETHKPCEKSEKIKEKSVGFGYENIGKSESKWLIENRKFMDKKRPTFEEKTTRSGKRFGGDGDSERKTTKKEKKK
jgi:hypothetical protein